MRTNYEQLLENCKYDPKRYRTYSEFIIAWIKLKEYCYFKSREVSK